jgi:hypothetical protein
VASQGKAAPEEVERRPAVLVADDDLPVEHDRVALQRRGEVAELGEPVGGARAGVEPQAAVDGGDEPKAVPFHLRHPAVALRD